MIFDNTIAREDFNKSLILKGLESFTDVQVEQWTKEAKEILEKSTKEELNDIEKSQLEEFTVYAPNLCKVTVVNDDLTKSLMYYRTAQVEWEKSEDGEIMKSRAGTYANTSENKKLGRVGQKYGESKKQEESKEDNPSKSGYSDYKQSDHKDSIEQHKEAIKNGGDKEHHDKYIKLHQGFIDEYNQATSRLRDLEPKKEEQKTIDEDKVLSILKDKYGYGDISSQYFEEVQDKKSFMKIDSEEEYAKKLSEYIEKQ